MIKKCMSTGLKYLCKTTSSAKRSPYDYKGSGKYWLRHVNKHKSYVITCIVGSYDTKEQLKENGIRLSEDYNIVESTEWANLTPEQGDGGWIHDQTGNTWKVKDTSNMGKHKNQWVNDDGTRRQQQSERMLKYNPSYSNKKTEKQIESSRKASVIASEASKKKILATDIHTNQSTLFDSKRATIKHFNISYDVLNYRLKTGKLYQSYKFIEVKDDRQI